MTGTDISEQETKYRQLAETIDHATAPDTRVVYLADTNHYRLSEIYGAFANQPFWKEMKKDGRQNVLGVEIYPSSVQPAFDAYFDHKITRAEFIETFAPKETSGQFTSDEAKKVLNGLADAMDSGVRVVGLNNGQDLGGPHMMESQRLLTQLFLQQINWFRGQSEVFKTDPGAVVGPLVERGDERLADMSPAQAKEYLAIKGEILTALGENKPVDKDDLLYLYRTTEPLYKAHLEQKNAQEEVGPIDLQKRLARDDQVVGSIKEYAADPNSRVFVLYGAAHAGGENGMVSQLQQDGLKTQLVVPYLGKNQYACLKPDQPLCVMIERDSSAISAYMGSLLASLDYLKIPDINQPAQAVTVKAPVQGVFSGSYGEADNTQRQRPAPSRNPQPATLSYN